MQSGTALSFDIVCHDLDPDFIKDLSIGVAWGYYTLFEDIVSEPGLPECLRLEEFGRRRGQQVVRAMKRAADKHGVPYEFLRLETNGQNKLLLKAGRVIIIQEPIKTLYDEPSAADYKVKLASVHSLVRQLELELGDIVRHVSDWSGCVLGVLLHGASGPEFTEAQRKLGALMLGVPDAGYSQWVHRLNLHQLAMFGHGENALAALRLDPSNTEQPDNVSVTPKRKNVRKDGRL